MNDKGRSEEELRAMAAVCEQRKEDSFQRSDTDGFVSQWASGLTAELYRTQADIRASGDMAEFTGLYEGNRRVKARIVSYHNKYTHRQDIKWVVADDDPVCKKRKWIPVGKNSRIQRELGLHEEKELAAAWAKMDGRGTGLSGTAWVATYRTGDKWGLDSIRLEDVS
jgi:hypothetical protein